MPSLSSIQKNVEIQSDCNELLQKKIVKIKSDCNELLHNTKKNNQRRIAKKSKVTKNVDFASNKCKNMIKNLPTVSKIDVQDNSFRRFGIGMSFKQSKLEQNKKTLKNLSKTEHIDNKPKEKISSMNFGDKNYEVYPPTQQISREFKRVGENVYCVILSPASFY